jgi:hypothetical protein
VAARRIVYVVDATGVVAMNQDAAFAANWPGGSPPPSRRENFVIRTIHFESMATERL